MPSLYQATARMASAGERSVGSGQQINASPSADKTSSDGGAFVRPATLDQEQLHQKLQELTEEVQSRQRDLSFSVDDDTGRTVVKVINSYTEEVVRQIPAEEILQIARRIENGEGGMLELEA
ncbi:hypothetical protein GF377_07560 [candidate division GN15 bacterium]|nr:hypothetical protein [candidate division GN15 bacterium]